MQLTQQIGQKLAKIRDDKLIETYEKERASLYF